MPRCLLGGTNVAKLPHTIRYILSDIDLLVLQAHIFLYCFPVRAAVAMALILQNPRTEHQRNELIRRKYESFMLVW
jgi:hypothetical protein